jgi:hypothetical protein
MPTLPDASTISGFVRTPQAPLPSSSARGQERVSRLARWRGGSTSITRRNRCTAEHVGPVPGAAVPAQVSLRSTAMGKSQPAASNGLPCLKFAGKPPWMQEPLCGCATCTVGNDSRYLGVSAASDSETISLARGSTSSLKVPIQIS